MNVIDIDEVFDAVQTAVGDVKVVEVRLVLESDDGTFELTLPVAAASQRPADRASKPSPETERHQCALTLRGTLYVSDAVEADTRAHQSAVNYFGTRPYRLALDIEEQRSADGDVIGYEVSYTAHLVREDR